jgi:hypothetical protein
MDLRRIAIEEKSVHGIDMEGEEFHAGNISADEAHLLLTDARAFLEKAKIKVPPNAQIRITNSSTRPPVAGSSAARARAMYRVIVIISGPVVVIIFDDGTVVVVAHCW